MSKTETLDQEVEEIYSILKREISKVPCKVQLVAMGVFNAKMGSTVSENIPNVGIHGLGNRNESEERLLNLAVESNLTDANTLIQHNLRRLSTWNNPDTVTKSIIF